MKVRLCVKLFDFIPRWILVHLTWHLLRFVPKFSRDSYVEFQEKNISEEFFTCKPRLSSNKTCEILPYFLQFFSGFVLHWKFLKKFMQVASYVVCTQVRRHAGKQITKKKIQGKKPKTFCSRKTTLFILSLGFTTPYSLRI